MKNKLIKFLSLFSVLILIVSCFCFNISAAETVAVDFINPNNIPYEEKNLTIFYSDNSQNLLLGGDSVSVPLVNSSDNILTVVNGQVEVTEGRYISVPGVSDGTYISLFAYLCDIFQIDGQTYSCPLVPGAIVIPVDEGPDGMSFKFYDELPELISIEVVEEYSGLNSLINYVLVPYEAPKPIDSVSNVWTSILTWITTSVNSVVGIFWTGTQLTLIGTLALVGTAIALCLLIYNKIKDFLRLQ